jgi:hypothetical protein
LLLIQCFGYHYKNKYKKTKKTGTIMLDRSLNDTIAESNSIQWNRNWKSDAQPTNLSVPEYLELARKFRIQALLTAKRVLEKFPNAIIKDDKVPSAGYYSLTGNPVNGLKTQSIDSLIAELEQNDSIFNKIGFIKRQIEVAKHQNDKVSLARLTAELTPFNGYIPDNRFLKTLDSAYRKLPDYAVRGKQHPEKLGDYLRLQILFDGAGDLALARHTLQFGGIAHITSQKDKLRRPDLESGHRSFMARILLGNDEAEHFKFETMLSLIEVESYGVDKTFRESERASLEMGKNCDQSQPGLSNAFFSAAAVLEKLRKVSLLNLYQNKDGMNNLLDPDINPHATKALTTAQVHFESASCMSILRKLPTVVKQFPELFETERHMH